MGHYSTKHGWNYAGIVDFTSDSVDTITQLVRSGDLSAQEVVQHSLATIEARNPVINAFVAVDGEGALAQAAAIDDQVAAGIDPGQLAGIPIGVKDLEPVAGFVTSFGSALHVNDPPAREDSVLVARMRAAGAVVVGKTNTPEYGHKGATDNVPFGTTTNPWNTDYSPGGSSGGTAAALAAGMIPLGTGSDGGGSIRIPSALCGLSGLKTETGRIPIAGQKMPGSGLLSCNGPMARTAVDTAAALDVGSGFHGRDPLSAVAPTMTFVDAVKSAEPPEKVVWCPTFGFANLDAEVLASCTSAVESLAAAGTEIVEIDTIWSKDPVMDWLVLWGRQPTKGPGTPSRY